MTKIKTILVLKFISIEDKNKLCNGIMVNSYTNYQKNGNFIF
jgi:hypothetical protein